MAEAHPQSAPQLPTDNGVSQLNNSNARRSVTDTGPERDAAPSTGNATSTSAPTGRRASSDSASHSRSAVRAAHP